MKDQINIGNAKAEFLDIKTAKNPIYQPMAGKVNLRPIDKILVTHEEKPEATLPISKNETSNTTQDPKSFGSVNQSEISKTENLGISTVESKAIKPALNLESTLKLVEELHRRMVQRGRLVYTINNLEKFKIEQKDEAEDSDTNYYQGCVLEISDDKRNKFSTKNPVIIKAVALFVRDLCTNRLGEIEAEIILPN